MSKYPEIESKMKKTAEVLYDGRTKNAVPLGISGGCSSGGSWIDAQAYLEPKQTPGEELTLLRTSVCTLVFNVGKNFPTRLRRVLI